MHRLARLAAPLLAIGLPLGVSANARTPRGGGDPLLGPWELSIKATCFPFDGSAVFKESSFTTVTISPAVAAEGVFAPNLDMTGFTVVPNSPMGAFAFDAMTGTRYGSEFYLVGETDFGSFRGRAKIDSGGTATSFKATAHNVDAFGLIDAKIKGTRPATK